MGRLPAHDRKKWLAAVLLCFVSSAAAGQSDPPTTTKELDSRAATRLLVNEVKPEYPAVARVNYIHGQVQMQLTVAPDGHVRRAHVLGGHPLLAASALRAIRHWIYRPFVTDAGPTPFRTRINVRFDLRENDLKQVPSEPERDLERQVKPPQVLQRTPAALDGHAVRLRVLVGEDGRAIDSTLVSGPPALADAAEENLTHWTFQPARWGTLSVPWYLDVDVPVQTERAAEPAAPPKP